MNLANEGLEARRKEEEAATKKRKAEEDARWEGTHPPILPHRGRLILSAHWQKIERLGWTAGERSTLGKRKRSLRLMCWDRI